MAVYEKIRRLSESYACKFSDETNAGLVLASEVTRLQAVEEAAKDVLWQWANGTMPTKPGQMEKLFEAVHGPVPLPAPKMTEAKP